MPTLQYFAGVESVSSSFADELIAKLYKEYGKEKFLNFVKLENVDDAIKDIINFTIRDRLSSMV